VLAPLRDEMRDFLLTERDFEKIRALIHKRAGISLGSHKREMVYSRWPGGCARCSLRLRHLSALLEADERSSSGSTSPTR
jgi:chemotaxis protein methyltransferase CheR